MAHSASVCLNIMHICCAIRSSFGNKNVRDFVFGDRNNYQQSTKDQVLWTNLVLNFVWKCLTLHAAKLISFLDWFLYTVEPLAFLTFLLSVPVSPRGILINQ